LAMPEQTTISSSGGSNDNYLLVGILTHVPCLMGG
jgi:hypothetical protein